MSILNYKGRNIYYDVQGEGLPILILNGIMMSTKSWEPFVESLSEHNMLIRLDFIDQGQSDKLENSVYNQEIQVDIVDTLLSHLKLDQINLVGISYGGEVAIQYAAKYPSKVRRLILFNTTAYTSPWLAETGKMWNAIGRTRNGQAYYQATIPVIYSPSFYDNNLDWMKKREAVLLPLFSNPVFLDAMERLTNSAEQYDARASLKDITAKTLIVGSDEDYLTPLNNQKLLHKEITNSEFVIIPGAGHASMYEKPLTFISLILGFVNAKQETFII